MADASRRAAARPDRGGLANTLFLQASLESLSPSLEAVADEITINYPWGSLLRAVAMPDAHLLSKLAAVSRSGARLELHINTHPFRDHSYVARIGLAGALLMTGRDAFVAAYAGAGLVVTEISDVSGSATSWGKRLAHGARRILRIRATRS
jgi:16S rRNA (adenine(1408)-N(1))-methyltransferase